MGLGTRTSKRRAGSAVALLAVFVVGTGLMAVRPAHGQPRGSVQGTVVDDADGAPQAAAVVTLPEIGLTVTTGPDGRFAFDDLPSGDYDLTVTREGFAPVTSSITVSAGLPIQLKVRLPAAGFEESVTVAGTPRELGLTDETDIGSRLGLRAIDIPASIDVIDSVAMESRGFQRLTDAVETFPGVVTGENPAAPSSLSVRGFTRSQVTVLRDGVWLGPANMVMRPQNTFNLDRVELLRGPSSVLNGQGAVAGTVNAVTKQATPTATTDWNAQVSYGRFNTYQTAIGVNGPIHESLWYRVDASRYGSDGFVDRASSGSSNVTGGLLWRPTPRANLRFTVDYLDDNVGSYFGTPLLPAGAIVDPLDVIRTTTGEGLDARTRFPQLQRGRSGERLTPAAAPRRRRNRIERPGHPREYGVRFRRRPTLAERGGLRLLHDRRRRMHVCR